MQKQLDDLVSACCIKLSKAPYGAPILFQRKQDGSIRMCVDYKALNKVNIENKMQQIYLTDCLKPLSLQRLICDLVIGKCILKWVMNKKQHM